MAKVLLVDAAQCTGCEMCVDICSGVKTGIYAEDRARIRVLKDEVEAVFVPLVCEQCREHPCAEACPVSAIRYDTALSIFTVEEETCTGCGICEKVCPYKGIFVSGGLAMKCDLCRGDPACVALCYPKALQYLNVNEALVRKDLALKIDKLNKMEALLGEEGLGF